MFCVYLFIYKKILAKKLHKQFQREETTLSASLVYACSSAACTGS